MSFVETTSIWHLFRGKGLSATCIWLWQQKTVRETETGRETEKIGGEDRGEGAGSTM